MDLTPLQAAAQSAKASTAGINNPRFTSGIEVGIRRSLIGHFGKLYDFSWGTDSQTLLSAAQDGKIIIWNAHRKLKKRVFSLESKWTFCCDLSPSMTVCASGGLDNTVSVFQTALNDSSVNTSDLKPTFLREHDGYLSGMCFLTDSKMLTTSGDSTAIIWDIERTSSILRLREHDSDVLTGQPCPTARESIFATGSCDASLRIWDVRTSKKSVVKISRHESDVNRVRWVPESSWVVASGSDDFTVRLHDIRCGKAELNVFCEERIISGVSCLDFTRSGKLLFVGHEDNTIRVWNTVTGTTTSEFPAAGKRVTALEVSPDGMAVCSADWEGILNVWA